MLEAANSSQTRSVWEAIGRGLKRVNTTGVQLEVYKSNWTGGDSTKMASIQKGFDSERSRR